MPGISGLSLYLPPYRVQLANWCEWNNQPWEKVRSVVGRSFRMRGPQQSVYTLAANAVWRLIRAYEIDPGSIGYLALGTESSSDNSAGAVIVRGMIDDALAAHGEPGLSRECEVPEFKHACLGGVYALKAGLRYLATDGADRRAIVVCADIAEYARGSTGEPTQGAGAVAMLLEAEPRLLDIDLARAGSASAYRMVDFRKPFARFRGQPQRHDGQMQDLPVFNGRYSTSCYVDATRHAVNAMLARRSARAADYFRAVDAVFMHRPYHRMPAAGWGMAWLFALADGDASAVAELRRHCDAAQIDADRLLAEIGGAPPDMRARVERGAASGEDVFALATDLLRRMRGTDAYRARVDDKLALGSDRMRDLGNLYTAALPAWLAAGLAQAAADDLAIEGQHWLALGYGSGDAAEALPMTVADGWREAASRIDFDAALGAPLDLTARQYVALHDGHPAALDPLPVSDEFVVDRIGCSDTAEFRDVGVEYYRYVPGVRVVGGRRAAG